MSYRDIIEQKKREHASTVDFPTEVGTYEEAIDFKYFGLENLRNIPTCIDLRFSDGNCEAIPYSFLNSIRYNSDIGITIKTLNNTITIQGYNLKLLYHYLASYRVRYIQEQIGLIVQGENNLVITSINIEEQ